MKAYVLAAGYATRLYPLTRDRPKALLEVAGRPLLSHTFDRLCALDGLEEVVVVSNHRFIADFERWHDRLASAQRVVMLDDGSTCEADKLGAVGDLAFALEQVPAGDEDFVVAAADNWLGFDLHPIQRDFEAQGHRPMLVLRRRPPAPGPSPYNEVGIDEAGRVLHFREKPVDPHGEWMAIALYFHPPRSVRLLRAYLETGGNPDAPGHFVEWLVRHAPVRSHRLPDDAVWIDIGSPEALAEARTLLEGGTTGADPPG